MQTPALHWAYPQQLGMGRTHWEPDLTNQSPLGLQQAVTLADADLAVFRMSVQGVSMVDGGYGTSIYNGQTLQQICVISVATSSQVPLMLHDLQ